MFASKIFSFSCNNILTCRNRVCATNNLKHCKEQRALISTKALEKLGIPLPPKRPLTPYLRFAQVARPKIVQNQPDLQPRNVIRLIAQEWSKYDPEKKKLMQQEYESDRQRFSLEFEKYKQTITPEQQDLIQITKDKQVRAKELARLHEKKENLGRPKKPTTAFIKFMMDKIAQKDKNVKHKDWLKSVAKEWELLEEQEKENYVTRTKKELENYKFDLLNWEENMIRQGHIDVVRNKDLLETKPALRRSNKVMV